MKTHKQRSDAAYSAVLSHANYASIPSGEKVETKIKELLKDLRVLCDEYGVDFEKDSLIEESKLICPHCSADLTAKNSVIRDYVNKSSDEDAQDVSAYGHYTSETEDFVSDTFEGFKGQNFDLPDNSDKCESCNGDL